MSSSPLSHTSQIEDESGATCQEAAVKASRVAFVAEDLKLWENRGREGARGEGGKVARIRYEAR